MKPSKKNGVNYVSRQVLPFKRHIFLDIHYYRLSFLKKLRIVPIIKLDFACTFISEDTSPLIGQKRFYLRVNFLLFRT